MNESHATSQECPPAPSAGCPGGLYAVSVAAVAAALGAEFWIIHRLLAAHPAPAFALARDAYAALALGLAALVGQAAFVSVALIRRARTNAAEIVRLRSSLERRCREDELTKTFNRVAFDHMIVREMATLRRYGVPLCGLMLDADNFRAVNERLGYEAGDAILVELADLIKANVRKADCLFRWRSGRFLILAAGISPDQGGAFAAKLRDLVAGHAFSRGVALTVSVGHTHAAAEDTPETFVARMKTALSLARIDGPGRIAAA